MAGQDTSGSGPSANGPTPETTDFKSLVEAGLHAADQRDFEHAYELFDEAAQLAPEDARTRYNLALALQNLGDLENSVATYRRAIMIDPSLIEAYINLGYLYGKLGLDEEALDIFQRAIELDAENDELFVALGDAYRELGFLEDAIQAYAQALTINAENARARESLSDVQERVRFQTEHIARLEAQLRNGPGTPDHYAEAIGAYLEAQRYGEALEVARGATQLFGDDPAMFETLALVHEAMGESEHAVEAWRKVVEIDPTDIDAWERLGNNYLELGLVDPAVEAYRKCVELDPENPATHFNLAEALMETERYDEAILTYKTLLDEDTSDDALRADAFIGLAEAYNANEQYDEALSICDQLLRDFPDESMGLYQRATALDALGRYEEAIEAYINSLANDPLNADTYNDLADTYLQVNAIDDAIEMARMAISLSPDMDVAFETLASALRAAGQNEAADAADRQAQALREEQEEDAPQA